MSGIFGVLGGLDAAVREQVAVTLETSLAHRGPDGCGHVQTGELVMGHCLLDVARNGFHQTGGHLISFDGRLDNRAELADGLRLPCFPERDGALVIAAYIAWGRDCVKRLLGDFAFALYDEAEKTLFCGRDHFGVRPFFYASSAEGFMFSSEAQAILAADPALSSEIDDASLADYIAGHFPRPDATLYPGIKRLPPGHCCTIQNGSMTIQRYYGLDLGKAVDYSDAPQRLATIFEEAVRCRLQSPAQVGALLSGGLDSSSIVATAAPLLLASGATRLKTFSMVFPDDPRLDERGYIDAIVETNPIEPHFFDPSSVPPFRDYGRLVEAIGQPPLGLNLATNEALYRVAASQGVRVLLDGHAGDEALAYGTLRMADLAYSGAWWTLWREIRLLKAGYHISPASYFVRTVWQSGPHRRVRRWLGDIKRRMKRTRPTARGAQYVAAPFAQWADVVARRSKPLVSVQDFGREERLSHHTDITSDLQSYAHESLDLIASHVGIEMRFPFLDKRLVEFSMSLQSHEKLGEGHARLILRRAMAGRLPDVVRWRGSKVNFLPHLERGLLAHSRNLVDELLTDKQGKLAQYVNINLFRQIWASLKQGAPISGYDSQALCRVVAFGLWMQAPGASSFPSEFRGVPL